ncbi:hypothetical protein Avbf_14390 [Armadillidium vulgare]|nr:hypothetical protein Avbf_14390 [Armadillidium vulgare]
MASTVPWSGTPSHCPKPLSKASSQGMMPSSLALGMHRKSLEAAQQLQDTEGEHEQTGDEREEGSLRRQENLQQQQQSQEPLVDHLQHQEPSPLSEQQQQTQNPRHEPHLQENPMRNLQEPHRDHSGDDRSDTGMDDGSLNLRKKTAKVSTKP